jgi:hypothetical protein
LYGNFSRKEARLLGLQVYTANAGGTKTLFKLHADKDQIILDYVEELKKCGYEVIDFPPIEKFRNYFISNIILEPPIASE